MRKIELLIVGVILTVVAIVFCGCHESQKNEYNLPENWLNQFGGDSQSALMYKTARIVDAHTKKLIEIEEKLDKAIIDGDKVMLGSGYPDKKPQFVEYVIKDIISNGVPIHKIDPNGGDPNAGTN